MKWLVLALAFFSAVLAVQNYRLKLEYDAIVLQNQQEQIRALQSAREKDGAILNEVSGIERDLSTKMQELSAQYATAQDQLQQRHSGSMGPSFGIVPSDSFSARSVFMLEQSTASLLMPSNASAHSAPAREPSTPAQSKPPRASAGAASTALKHLQRCEQRLIYEAGEYDALAHHYNALLAIYEKIREVNNDASQEKRPR